MPAAPVQVKKDILKRGPVENEILNGLSAMRSHRDCASPVQRFLAALRQLISRYRVERAEWAQILYGRQMRWGAHEPGGAAAICRRSGCQTVKGANRSSTFPLLSAKESSRTPTFSRSVR